MDSNASESSGGSMLPRKARGSAPEVDTRFSENKIKNSPYSFLSAACRQLSLIRESVFTAAV